MKHFFIFITLLFLAAPTFGQKFVAGIIVGGNLTQVDGDWVSGYYKFGANGGASVMLALNTKQTWFGTIELLYTQKGAYQRNWSESMTPIPSFIDEDYDYNHKIK